MEKMINWSISIAQKVALDLLFEIEKSHELDVINFRQPFKLEPATLILKEIPVRFVQFQSFVTHLKKDKKGQGTNVIKVLKLASCSKLFLACKFNVLFWPFFCSREGLICSVSLGMPVLSVEKGHYHWYEIWYLFSPLFQKLLSHRVPRSIIVVLCWLVVWVGGSLQ